MHFSRFKRVLENLVALTISKVRIVGILVSNRAARNLLVTTIADIGALVQPGSNVLWIGAGLLAWVGQKYI